MKEKHIQMRVEQCLALSKVSNCPRRKFGAMLLDPERNVVLMDGYNGGPRGGKGSLCAGWYCKRDGLKKEDFKFEPSRDTGANEDKGYTYHKPSDRFMPGLWRRDESATRLDDLITANPPIPSGQGHEQGCHHAEMNVICNAAAGGVKTAGAWLVITGEPCLLCAKLIHHAGITKVIVVDGGYSGPNALVYLKEHGIQVEKRAGPKDPRTS
jgi:dCMP deaminase